MGRILILNGSPRAPKSNSKRYAGLFMDCCKADYAEITKTNHRELYARTGEYTDLVLAFPLYADGLPVTLLDFLKTLEAEPPKQKPTVSVLINCGFLEYAQNHTAVEMVALFCRQNGWSFGSVLEIGGGEAIWDTPFRFLAAGSIKKFARSVEKKRYARFHTTMPLPKSMFLKASAAYWTEYGKKYNISKEEMQTMQIEQT